MISVPSVPTASSMPVADVTEGGNQHDSHLFSEQWRRLGEKIDREREARG